MTTVCMPYGNLQLYMIDRVSLAAASSSNVFIDNVPSSSATLVTVVQGFPINTSTVRTTHPMRGL